MLSDAERRFGFDRFRRIHRIRETYYDGRSRSATEKNLVHDTPPWLLATGWSEKEHEHEHEQNYYNKEKKLKQ